VDLW